MSVYSSGSKWLNAARGAMASARALEDQQKDIDFGRALLSNIREQRLATAQLAVGNFTEGVQSSSSYGAVANVNSALAGEMGYSYETSLRQEEIQDYTKKAQEYMKKYADQQKTRATAFAVTGLAAGALAGGLAAGGLLGASAAGAVSSATGVASGTTAGVLAGASMFGQIGQGIGQMVSNTGTSQFTSGISNVLGGLSMGVRGSVGGLGFNLPKYQASSINTLTNSIIQDSSQTYVTGLNGSLIPLKGYY